MSLVKVFIRADLGLSSLVYTFIVSRDIGYSTSQKASLFFPVNKFIMSVPLFDLKVAAYKTLGGRYWR